MDISIFAWNCQGAASPRFVRSLKSLLHDHRPDLLVLSEPRVSGAKADGVIRKIGYRNSLRVESHGFSGGIWFLWKDTLSIRVLGMSRQYIHSLITVNSSDRSFLFTGIYASPTPSLRGPMWHDLPHLAPTSQTPWLLAGDLNVTSSANERRGSPSHRCRGDPDFQNFLRLSCLHDLGFVGPQFTWQRGPLRARLDRALCNDTWLMTWPATQVLHLPRIKSDHRPLLIKLPISPDRRPPPPFKFLASWLLHPEFQSLVQRDWLADGCVADNLATLSSSLQHWDKQVFGAVGLQKCRLRRRIGGVQRALEQPYPHPSLFALEQQLLEEHDALCMREELLWLQKSRAEWINDGDRNTHFYHTKALVRRRRNTVTILKDEAGQWHSDPPKLQRMAAEYFERLYECDPGPEPHFPYTGLFPALPAALTTSLTLPISKAEVRAALFDMKPLNAPGPDGFHSLFFQSQWDLVGDTLFREIRRFFDGGTLDARLNQTLIALIPKTEHPQVMKDFRPISLCSTVYKVITKIIASRLKPAMPILTGPQQSSFIAGRNITDNIIIAQEVIHTMNRTKGRKGYLAIKVDLEKAFDRIR